MILFRDEDDRYLAFLADPRNRDGFILNTLRQPSAFYLALHRAACHSVQGHPANGRRWTTGVYCKLWSADAGELQEWAARELQGVPKPCGLCRPLHATEHDASVAESHPDQEEDVIPETKPEPGRTDIGGELVLELACEGGGETIFRRRTERGWVYWRAGSTMDFDANALCSRRTPEYLMEMAKRRNTLAGMFGNTGPGFWETLFIPPFTPCALPTRTAKSI